jgi:hypothetical protein
MRLPPQAGPASRLKSVADTDKIRALTTKALDDFEGKPVGVYGPTGGRTTSCRSGRMRFTPMPEV